MYRIRPTTKFQKDVKRLKKRGYDLSSLTKVIQILADGKACRPKTETMPSAATMPVLENAILRRTGC